MYLPLAQHDIGVVKVAIKVTAGSEALVTNALRSVVASVDRDAPVTAVREAGALIGASVQQRRLTALLLAAFAAAALLLGAVGVYGVLAYDVGRRVPEIGVRLALGASRRDVLAIVLRRGALVSLSGIVAGVTMAVPATRAVGSLLVGVDAADPRVFAGVALALFAVALVASCIPAARAARVNPLVALRGD
jgi:putative ABC transport system permease protein